MTAYLSILFWLLVAHACTDVVGQSVRMARLKHRWLEANEWRRLLGLPHPFHHDANWETSRCTGDRICLNMQTVKNPHWMPWMLAHALLNGAGVALVTGNVWLGIAETLVHGVTDTLKCEHQITLLGDQMTHLVSKLVWAAL